MEKNGKGSGRSIAGFDLHEALVLSNKCLEKYGGHAMAIGLTIRKDKLNEFCQNFEKTMESSNIDDIIQIVKIDFEVTSKDMNTDTINELLKLEPFGEQNKMPIICYKNLKIVSIRSVSQGKHLKLTLKDDSNTIDAMGFGFGYLADEYLIGDKIDVAGTLEINSFKGIQTIQINIKDIMKSL